MKTDLERFTEFARSHCPEFDAFAATGPGRRHLSTVWRRQLTEFPIDQLEKALRDLVDIDALPEAKKDWCRLIRARVLVLRTERTPKGFCTTCRGQGRVGVLSVESIRQIAAGLAISPRYTSLLCECSTTGPKTFQQCRRDLRCVIEDQQLLNEAALRHPEYAKANGHVPPKGVTCFDLITCRVAYEWICAHWAIKHDRALRAQAPDPRRVEFFYREQSRYASEQSSDSFESESEVSDDQGKA